MECHKWSAAVAEQFVDEEDYEYDHEKKTVELTREGRQKVRLLAKPETMDTVGMVNIYHYIERAIMVEREYTRDRQYVIRDGEIVIVDEFTGRLAEGRKWREGLHQAVEAKEGVEVTVATGQAARVTIQDFFLRYENLAGMTGTAMDSARELPQIYRCHVLPIPTNRPAIRQRLRTQVFGTAEQKWAAVVEEICQLHAKGRPVLIGTRSIDKSEHLSKLLAAQGIEHAMLNAHHLAAEADIVAQAGQAGRVTVSTNMAGRGTDIKLGEGHRRARRPARDLHRNARRRPHRPPVGRPLRPARRSGHVPPVPGPGRRPAAGRPGTEEGRPARGVRPAAERAAGPPRPPLPQGPA